MLNINRNLLVNKLCKSALLVFVLVIQLPTHQCEEVIEKLKEQPKNKEGYFKSLLSGYCLIFISELLDRTFFLNMIYALNHSFLKTFIISSCTLLLLNFAALFLGNTMPIFFFKYYIDWFAVFVFFLIGSILIYDSIRINGHIMYDEYKEVHKSVKKQSSASRKNSLEEPLIEEENIIFEEPAFDTTIAFVTSLILAECGDKSQITGVLIGAVYNFYGVLLGASLGLVTCIFLAIWSGQFLSKKISKRQINLISGIIFVVFGITYLLQILRVL